MSARGAKSGFTLVEMLIALAIVGMLFSAIVSLTGMMLSYSSRVKVINERLADLNDAAGYVVTQARAAMYVAGDEATTAVPISFGGSDFSCWNDLDGSALGDCIALVVPVVDRATADITGYDLLAYRVVAIRDWDDNPGLTGWNGLDTPVLLEYQVPLCTIAINPTCNPSSDVPGPAASAKPASRVSLVIGDLVFEDETGAAFEPFGVSLLTTELQFRLRARAPGRFADVEIPANDVIELSAIRRP